MGGVINSVLKSGSNEFHGSAFSYWAPYWMSGNPNAITTVGGSLGYVASPTTTSASAPRSAGPIIKDKLFFWAGFAPRFKNTHVFRQTYSAHPTTLDANGNPIAQAESRTGAPA